MTLSLPYEFSDPSLLELALTHASTGGDDDNERLEFLGDAVLDLIVAEELFANHPERREGELTENKAEIVSRRPLAEAAFAMGLDDAARTGPGLARRTLPKSVMANLYEAVLGAVYLDGGLEVSRQFVHTTLAKAMSEAGQRPGERNPKQELQQLCQRRWNTPPRYVEIECRGLAHARAFRVAAQVEGEFYPEAWGRTRKEAESWAAYEALLLLREDDESDTADEYAEVS